GGSKSDVWRPSTTINSALLPEDYSNSSLGAIKPQSTWSSVEPDLETHSFSAAPLDFSRFPLPPSNLCHFGVSTSKAIARFLLATNAMAQVCATGLPSVTTPQTTTAPATSCSNSGQRYDKNLFSIADHIKNDAKGENKTNDRNGSKPICCPICHEDLTSTDLSAHISLELETLDKETQRWQSWQPDQSVYERCMAFQTSGLFDEVSSNQRFHKFQLVKQRRLARRFNFSIRDYSFGIQQCPRATTGSYPYDCSTSASAFPTKIRRMEK
uniref:E3 ubiquitin-protein ligase n=1 Tax=Mesocestoides corti TaxID=53468 RepID=A0A5K3F389_MESCO